MQTILFEDLSALSWGWPPSARAAAGTFLKTVTQKEGRTLFYKLPSFDRTRGTFGHECVNELIASRILTKLKVEHAKVDLVQAKVKLGERIYETQVCVSEDFLGPSQSKIAFEDFFEAAAKTGEDPAAFMRRQGWGSFLRELIAFDFLIINRDRHGANVEIIRDSKSRSYRPAPLFDHGCSLIFSCHDEKAARAFDPGADIAAQSLFGGFGKTLLRDNLRHLKGRGLPFKGTRRLYQIHVDFKPILSISDDIGQCIQSPKRGGTKVLEQVDRDVLFLSLADAPLD